VTQAMLGKIMGRFRMKFWRSDFVAGLTDSNSEAFHRRRLTKASATSL
jgi:hypothetical protein